MACEAGGTAMSVWEDYNELADVLAEHLFKDREDARCASREVADAIRDLIESMIESKTGAV
jgi:hypothetical protein